MEKVHPTLPETKTIALSLPPIVGNDKIIKTFAFDVTKKTWHLTSSLPFKQN